VAGSDQPAPAARLRRYIGYVDAKDRRALYEGRAPARAALIRRGIRIPVLEAMSVGVPVVAASRGSLPEVLGGAGLLVESRTSQPTSRERSRACWTTKRSRRRALSAE